MTLECREYLMYYRRQAFLAILWFGSSSHPPHPPFSKIDRRHTGRLKKRDNFLTGEGEGVEGGAKSYDGKKPGPLLYIKYCLLEPFPPDMHMTDMQYFFYLDKNHQNTLQEGSSWRQEPGMENTSATPFIWRWRQACFSTNYKTVPQTNP